MLDFIDRNHNQEGTELKYSDLMREMWNLQNIYDFEGNIINDK